MKDYRRLIAGVILSSTLLFLFWPFLGAPFLSDDFVHVHLFMESADLLGDLAKNFYSNWMNVPTTRMYRPLTTLTMAIDWMLWRGRPAGFHFTNVLLHVLCAGLLYRCLHGLSRHRRWSAWLAILFLLYPGQFETSYWIIGRVGSLAVMFALAAVALALPPEISTRRRWGIGVALFLAMLSKETGVIGFPVLVFMRFYLMGLSLRRESIRSMAIDLGPATAFVVLYLCIYHFAIGLGSLPYQGMPISRWIPGTDQVYLLPGVLFPLNSLYLDLPINITRGIQVAFFLLFTAAIALVWSRSREEQKLPTGLIFLLIVLSSVIPMLGFMVVMPDLQGTRHFYHVVAFAFLGLGMIRPKSQIALVSGAGTAMALTVLLYVIAFGINLRPWERVAQGVKEVDQGLSNIFTESLRQSDVLRDWTLYGEIDNYYGSFFLRNAMGGFLKLTNPVALNYGLSPLSTTDVPSSQAALLRRLVISDPARARQILRFSFEEGFGSFQRPADAKLDSLVKIRQSHLKWTEPPRITYRDLEVATGVVLEVESLPESGGSLCFEWFYVEFDRRVRTRGIHCTEHSRLAIPLDVFPEWLEVSRIRSLHTFYRGEQIAQVRFSLEKARSRPILAHLPPGQSAGSYLTNVQLAPIGGMTFRKVPAGDASVLEIDFFRELEGELTLQASRDILFLDSIATVPSVSHRPIADRIQRLGILSPFPPRPGTFWYLRGCVLDRCSTPISFFEY